MCRPAVLLALAVLLAGGHAAETRDCARGDEQCVVSADHALLATKVQVERSRSLADAQPVPPVSTTMKCVISVTILYFVIYTSLFLVKSAQEVTGQKYALHDVLTDATETVAYAPMISVLFIGTRMRAIAVTRGDPEAYDLPQWWCKDAMIVSASCVFALTVISIMEKLAPGMATVLTFAQYAADALLYAGFAVVAYGFYFFVAILFQLGVTYDLLSGKKGEAEKTESSSL